MRVRGRGTPYQVALSQTLYSPVPAGAASPFRCCDPPTSPPRRAVAFFSLYLEGLEGLVTNKTVVSAREGLQGTQSCHDCLEVGCPGLPQDCGVFQLPGDALRGT